MDVDNELDSGLLEQFSSMGTTDKEVLITEFQKLLGNQLNPAGCEFFLEMNKWNLQAAVCAYYDFEQPSVKPPKMSFVRDITIGEGESVPPNTDFVKCWQVQNSGDEVWPECCLQFISGEQFGNVERVNVARLGPGAVTDISVNMHSPLVHGIYQGQWRMKTDRGVYFGDTIWVILQVDSGGILSVTQQMSRFGSDFTSPAENRDWTTVDNPFATPPKLSSSLPTSSAFPMQGGSPSSVSAQHGSTPNSPRLLDTSTSVFNSPRHLDRSLDTHHRPSATLPIYTNHSRQTLFQHNPSENPGAFLPPSDYPVTNPLHHSQGIHPSENPSENPSVTLTSQTNQDMMDDEMS